MFLLLYEFVLLPFILSQLLFFQIKLHVFLTELLELPLVFEIFSEIFSILSALLVEILLQLVNLILPILYILLILSDLFRSQLVVDVLFIALGIVSQQVLKLLLPEFSSKIFNGHF